ncbi:MAG TPA: nuclear transport factor 2 family protein [Thermoleophilaceae bacterium]|nr:nuclear transport factor 2 family protein [Thermoleophilaceae bacterium]
MPGSNRAVVEEVYRRMNARDLSVAELLHPNIEWHWPDDSLGRSLYRGVEEMSHGLASWSESWGEFQMEPVEVIERDDDVFVVVNYRVRGAGSGVPIEQELGHVLRLRDRRVTHWWMFADAAEARRRFLEGERPG